MQNTDLNRATTSAPEPKGIVSVNSRGGASSGLAGKVIFVLVVLAILVIAGLITFNKMRASQKVEDNANKQTTSNVNKPAAVGERRVFNTDPPPLPAGALPKDAAANGALAQQGQGQPGCPEGIGQVLLGPDGKPMLGPTGDPMRVCKDGRVVVPALQTPPGGAAPIGVAGGGTANGAPPPPSRYAGDVLVPSGGNVLAGATGTSGRPDPYSNPFIKQMLERAGVQQTSTGAMGSSSAGEATSSGAAAGAPQSRGGGNSSPQGSIGNLLQGSSTPAVSASMIGDRNMILPRGRTLECNLSTRIVNEVSGMASCVFSANVYSDNGKVVLAERGSEATGEYIAAMAQGQRRLFILWTRIKTPKGVVVDINSPASDALGTSGVAGYIDNRWTARIGAAFLLSIVQDAIAYETAKATSGDGSGAGGTVVLQNTSQAGSTIASKVLDSTINIKPTLYKNQGDSASIFVARDVDFGSVYALRAN